MTYAILTGNTITVHGPASVLWPDTSFAANGPNASFLADAGAVTIRANAAYDPATEFLQSCEPYALDGAVFNTIAAPIPPAPPTPDWGTFRRGLLTSADVAQAMTAARAAGAEPAATNLPMALKDAQAGNPAEFAACWGLVVAAGGASPEALAALVAAAEACNLPSEFVAALSPE